MLVISKDLALMEAEEQSWGEEEGREEGREDGRQAGLVEENIRLRNILTQILALLEE